MTPQDPRPRWIRCSPFSWGSFIPYNMPVYPRALRTADDPLGSTGGKSARISRTLAAYAGQRDTLAVVRSGRSSRSLQQPAWRVDDGWSRQVGWYGSVAVPAIM